MLYRNKRTGVLIETSCRISGGDWEPVKAEKTIKSKTTVREKTEASE